MLKATECGLQLEQQVGEFARMMDGPYSRHEYRYMPETTYTKFDLAVTLPLVDRLEAQVGVLIGAKESILAAERRRVADTAS